jgi:hypothetical protein
LILIGYQRETWNLKLSVESLVDFFFVEFHEFITMDRVAYQDDFIVGV